MNSRPLIVQLCAIGVAVAIAACASAAAPPTEGHGRYVADRRIGNVPD
jgi:hypothetical protein